MVNAMQRALIKKDFRSITSNKRMFSVLLIVPLVLVVVMPSIFMMTIMFTPVDSGDFKDLLAMIPQGIATEDSRRMLVGLLLNNILPVFFLLIPIMAASVMAAGSFIGEKEKNTLETLLYCPMTLREIFNAKILASFLMSMLVSGVSFLVMILVVETELILITGGLVMPNINWLILMLLAAPAVSLIAITLIVRGSAKARTSEEAQQRSVFLILPIIMIAVGQFSGIMLIGPLMMLGLGLVLAAIAVLMLRSSFGRFRYEELLR